MHKKDIVTPSTVLSTFYTNVETHAHIAEQDYDQVLRPNKVGIYRINEHVPVLVPEVTYCKKDWVAINQLGVGVNRFTTIKCSTTGVEKIVKGTYLDILTPVRYEDLGKLNQAIFNTKGQQVVSAFEMKYKSRLLSVGPTLPIRGIRLIRDFVDYVVHNELQWYKSRYLENKLINKNIKPEYIDGFDIESLYSTFQQLRYQLCDFIGEDQWNHYYVTIHGYDLIVQKCADYRICEWYKMMSEKDTKNDDYE